MFQKFKLLYKLTLLCHGPQTWPFGYFRCTFSIFNIVQVRACNIKISRKNVVTWPQFQRAYWKFQFVWLQDCPFQIGSVEAIPQQAVVMSPFRNSRFFHRDYVRPWCFFVHFQSQVVKRSCKNTLMLWFLSLASFSSYGKLLDGFTFWFRFAR